MKILHVVELVSLTHGGGVAQVVTQLAKAQARLGHQVTIYSTDDKAKHQCPPSGVNQKLFHSIGHCFGAVAPAMLTGNFKGFDIMHLHNLRTITNLIAASKGIPFVLQALGNALPASAGIFQMPYDWVWSERLIKRARGLLACSEVEIGQYAALGADRRKVIQVDIGIPLEKYAHLPERKPNAVKRVLYLGKFHEIKGVDLLIEAFAWKYRGRADIRLVLAGWDDGYGDEAHKMVLELGIDRQVEYPGFIAGGEKLKAFVKADVWVAPSRYEAFGLGVIEALACGTPIIITDRYAIADRIPPCCGQVVPFDRGDLAGAIDKAITERHADINRSERIAWASQFSWDKIAPKVIEFYRRVAGC